MAARGRVRGGEDRRADEQSHAGVQSRSRQPQHPRRRQAAADDADADRRAPRRQALPRDRHARRRQPGSADPARPVEHHRFRHGRSGGDRGAARQFAASRELVRHASPAAGRPGGRVEPAGGGDRGAARARPRPRDAAGVRHLHRRRRRGHRPGDGAAPRRGGPPPRARHRRLVAMNIPFTKHTLQNGLDVLIHEDHSVPIVAVNVWYHVGSKNETPGRTGFAHLFEHLMFEGSQHYDRGYFHPLQEAGASLNGSTNADRTNYWEVVPTNALDLALWMESDRMGYLLPALTDAKFDNQRDVVLNERRQNYENRPYGLAGMAIVSALYPPHHPYHWLTIGAADDIRAAHIDDVRAFFQRYYHPRNSSLAMAGDIDPEEGVALAERYFAEVPSGVKPDRVTVPAAVTPREDVRMVLEDRVELPRLYLAWHSPALFADGDAELDLVAEVLSSGKTSRLYRALVYEQRIATEVAASQNSREAGSFFQIVATAAPGRTLAEVERAIAKEMARLVERGPTDIELERCLAQAEAHFLFRLQTVGGFGGKSDQLNAYNTFLGDPAYFARDLERYRSATPALLRAAAATHLKPTGRVILSVVPRGRVALALPGSQPVAVS